MESKERNELTRRDALLTASEGAQASSQGALHLVGLIALGAGGLLELSDLFFWGLDLLIGALFAMAIVLGWLDTLDRTKIGWGLFTAGLGALALALHLLASLHLYL